MKKLCFYLFILFVSVSAWAQKNNQIVIGTIDSLKSNILNETRKIWVYVPNQGNSFTSTQRYPVIYLLDGDDHFHSVSGLVQQLGVSNSTIPEMIVVGIPNTNRTRDLTPTHSLLGTDGKEAAFLSPSGGAENFTSFLEKELIPYVEAHYPTAPHRMLIGHSFGGLFAMNTIIHHPALFNTYIAIDPSMWWDKGKLLDEASAALRSSKLNGRSLFIGLANTMPAGMDTSKLSKDTASSTVHIRSILKLVKMGRRLPPKGLRLGWKYYPNDTHGSCVLNTEYDGVRFIYDFYKAPIGDPFKTTPESFVSQYKIVSDNLGYTILPPEPLVNNFGYAFLSRKEYDIAYGFFKMNVDNYPQSSNVFDSMGDYYIAKEDKAKAKEYFGKALSIKEVSETRKKFDSLK